MNYEFLKGFVLMGGGLHDEQNCDTQNSPSSPSSADLKGVGKDLLAISFDIVILVFEL